MSDKVKVTALKYHTHDGKSHEAEDTYEVPADQVENLVAQGMVSAPEPPPAKAKASHPVEPMTTDDLTGKKAKK